jgi:hypothetical protein
MDEDKFAGIASLDLSAAFDVVDRQLLFKRLETIGMPEDVTTLLKDWLQDRMSYVEVRGSSSYMRNSDSGTVQGSVLGPILFSIFIRPIYDLEELTTYADDNYVMKESSDLKEVVVSLKNSVTNVASWLKSSGLKVNDSKTELCIFHRKTRVQIEIELGGCMIQSKENISILGMTFDCQLRWDEQINNSIKNANRSLFALKVIKNHFNKNELTDLLTSLYFSKLFYGSEVWHLPELNFIQKKKLKNASANALKLCLYNTTPFMTHTEIHNLAKRSPPENYCKYKHAILIYKLFNNCIPAQEHLHLNFQLADNNRQEYLVFTRNQNYKVGNNILINRFVDLNNLIKKDWLSLSLEVFKIKCKDLFLKIE